MLHWLINKLRFNQNFEKMFSTSSHLLGGKVLSFSSEMRTILSLKRHIEASQTVYHHEVQFEIEFLASLKKWKLEGEL